MGSSLREALLPSRAFRRQPPGVMGLWQLRSHQASVDAILVGVDEGIFCDCGFDDRLDRGLLHVGQHAQNHLTTALDQAEDGRLVLLPRAPARCTCQPATTSEPPLLATAVGWPLWPATT